MSDNNVFNILQSHVLFTRKPPRHPHTFIQLRTHDINWVSDNFFSSFLYSSVYASANSVELVYANLHKKEMCILLEELVCLRSSICIMRTNQPTGWFHVGLGPMFGQFTIAHCVCVASCVACGVCVEVGWWVSSLSNMSHLTHVTHMLSTDAYVDGNK